MKCGCLARINKSIKDKNIQVATGFEFIESTSEKGRVATLQQRVVIATEKIDQKLRKRPPLLMASYCPFCGMSVDDKDAVSEMGGGDVDGVEEYCMKRGQEG